MIKVLFSAPSSSWADYQAPLRRAFDEVGLCCDVSAQTDDPAGIDYLIYAPGGPVDDFTPFKNAKAVLSLWAGVENIITNKTLHLPLARMVDSGLAQGMSEWVTAQVLRHHLDMDRHILGQDGVWRPAAPPLARDRTVAILGLGTLGKACASALKALNFKVTGWSRQQKNLPGIGCYRGKDGLDTLLSQAQILVLLLPQTAQTTHIINAQNLARLPKGAIIINPGRGGLIDDAALLSALDSGHIAHATLDVFTQEPLPPAHPYWAHKNVTVTPHIAARTRPATASQNIAQNIKRCEAGKPLLHRVDRTAGY